MRRSDWEDRCKRHPEHRLSKGVCPYCLRDRLAHLSASSSAATTTRASSSASTSPYSSAGSPPPHHAALSADVSAVHVVGGGSSFVNVAAFSQPLMPTSVKKQGRQEEASGREAVKGKEEVKKKKKSGKKNKKIGRFLSRLVGAEKRRQTGDGDGSELFHSKTMKEKTSSKWHPGKCSSSSTAKHMEEAKGKFQEIQGAYFGHVYQQTHPPTFLSSRPCSCLTISF